MFGRRRAPRTYNTATTTRAPRTYNTTTRAPRRSGGLFGRRHHHTAPRTNYEAGYNAGYNAGEHQHVQHRRASIGDKISGAFMKLQGTLTRRPGLKAAGTRRMHGTDGRGTHRTYY